MEQELIINFKEIKVGDKVKGSDGKWYNVLEVLPIHIPNRMFEICTSAGNIKCSDTHLWNLYRCLGDNKTFIGTVETSVIFDNFLILKDTIIGKIDSNVLLKDIKEITPEPSRCIVVDSPDHQFEILTDNINLTEIDLKDIDNKKLENISVLTHNCGMRMVCGQLGSIASRMALDNQDATTIDGAHKGAGMIKSQGQVSNIQYYFEQQKWIEDWFTKRGLTKKGWEPSEDPNASIDPSTIDLGEDEDIEIAESKTEIDFNGIHREIDNTKDQKFEEI